MQLWHLCQLFGELWRGRGSHLPMYFWHLLSVLSLGTLWSVRVREGLREIQVVHLGGGLIYLNNIVKPPEGVSHHPHVRVLSPGPVHIELVLVCALRELYDCVEVISALVEWDLLPVAEGARYEHLVCRLWPPEYTGALGCFFSLSLLYGISSGLSRGRPLYRLVRVFDWRLFS